MSDKKPESHSSSQQGYRVEARNTYGPRAVGEQLFDGEWRKVQFNRVPEGFGVPSARAHECHFPMMGLMNYEAAQALRWWFMANVGPYHGFETRLVRHLVTMEVKVHEGEPVEQAPSGVAP